MDDKWDDISKIETQSKTHLEDDEGTGGTAVVRSFEFSANPEAFRQHTPTRQELFNYHHKQIEIALWADGLKVMPDVAPKVTISKKKDKYRIIVSAKPMRGRWVYAKPQKLADIIHSK